MVIYFRFIVWCEGLTQGFHTTGFSSYLWLKPTPVQVVPVKGTGFTGTGVVCHFSTLGLTLLFTIHIQGGGDICWQHLAIISPVKTPAAWMDSWTIFLNARMSTVQRELQDHPTPSKPFHGSPFLIEGDTTP